jgi:hypothetical protein
MKDKEEVPYNKWVKGSATDPEDKGGYGPVL